MCANDQKETRMKAWIQLTTMWIVSTAVLSGCGKGSLDSNNTSARSADVVTNRCAGSGNGSSSLVSTNVPDRPVEPWRSDWYAFVAQLSAVASENEDYSDRVKSAFGGKTVTWEGRVSQVEPPKTIGGTADIQMAVKPAILSVGYNKMTVESLRLMPQGIEWDSWKTVSVGSDVVFTTRVHPTCVFVVMVGMGANAGKSHAIIQTDGAKCVGIKAQKPVSNGSLRD